MMGHRLGAAALLTASMLLYSQAAATVANRLANDQLIDRSTVIIRGTVVGQQAAAFGDEIWTDSYVRVEDSLKGGVSLGRVLRIRQPGGELGRRGMRVAGAASFHQGEHVLLYLRPIKGGLFVVGLSQGKFSIYKAADGIETLRQDLRGIVFANPSPSGQTQLIHVDPESAAKGLSLKAHLSRIRAVSKGGKR